jgi:hypothetical protein
MNAKAAMIMTTTATAANMYTVLLLLEAVVVLVVVLLVALDPLVVLCDWPLDVLLEMVAWVNVSVWTIGWTRVDVCE